MKRFVFVMALLYSALLLSSCGTYKSVHDKPATACYNATVPVVVKLNDSVRQSGDNFLLKNKQGLWELYVEGDPLQRGLMTGALTTDLIHYQEEAFFEKIKDIVPSNFKLFSNLAATVNAAP